MEWFSVPNLLNAIVAVGAFAIKSELSNIKNQLAEVRADVREAHKRIDDILLRLK